MMVIVVIIMLTGCIRLTFVDQPSPKQKENITEVEEEKSDIEKVVEDGVDTIKDSVGVELYKDF